VVKILESFQIAGAHLNITYKEIFSEVLNTILTAMRGEKSKDKIEERRGVTRGRRREEGKGEKRERRERRETTENKGEEREND
jgi:hypothetical protein